MRQTDDAYLKFDKHYREQWHRLCKLASVKLGNADFAEEVVEDTFLTAWVKRKEFLNSPNPVGWLFVTLDYKILNIFKNRQRLMCLNEDDIKEIGYCDTLDPLLSFRGIIPDEELHLLYSRYVRNTSYQELAAEMKIGLSACKMRVKRAKERFAKACEEENGN